MDSVIVMPGTVAAPRGGVLYEFHTRYETVREALSRIDTAAREMGLPDISTRLIEHNDTSDRRGPEVQYLEIFAVSIATHHMLIAEGVRPVAIVGQSIGELWALAAAGHLSVEDAARLAVARSQVLTRQSWDGKMLAVGVDGRRAESLAGLMNHPHLVVACENAPRQSVISGPEPLIEHVERVADALGWPSLRLDVPHPTHTPAMAQAARDLRATAPRIPYGAGRWRVCSPWLGRDVGDDDPVDLVAGALTALDALLTVVKGVVTGTDAVVAPAAGSPLIQFTRPGGPHHPSPAGEGAEQAARTEPAPGPAAPEHTEDGTGRRQTFQLVPTDPPQGDSATTPIPAGTIVITDAPDLAAVVTGPDIAIWSPRPGLEAATHVLPEAAPGALTGLPFIPRHIRVLSRLSDPGDGSEDAEATRLEDLQDLTFTTLQAALPALRTGGSLSALLLGALPDDLPPPTSGLFTGLVRSVRAEVPQCGGVTLLSDAPDAATALDQPARAGTAQVPPPAPPDPALTTPLLDGVLHRGENWAVFTKTWDPSTLAEQDGRWMRHHRVNGEYMLPGTFILEAAAGAAAVLCPGLVVTGFRGLVCRASITVRLAGPPRTVAVEARVTSRTGDRAEVAVRMTAHRIGKNGKVLPFNDLLCETTVVLADRFPALAGPPDCSSHEPEPDFAMPVYSPDPPISLTGPFAGTSDYARGPDGNSARFGLDHEAWAPALAGMTVPAILLDAMVHLLLLPPPGDHPPLVGPMAGLEEVDLGGPGDDCRISAENPDIRLHCEFATGALTAVSGDGRVLARISGVSAHALDHSGELVRPHAPQPPVS